MALPDITRRDARLLVLGVASFWALGMGGIAASGSPVSGLLVFAAVLAGLVFYVTLARVHGESLFVWPPTRRVDERTQVMVNLFRPSFVIRVLRATDWPGPLVAFVLGTLLVGSVTAVAMQ